MVLDFEGGLYSVLVVDVLLIQLLLPSVGDDAELMRLRLLQEVELLEGVVDESMRVVEHGNGIMDLSSCCDAHLVGLCRFVFRVAEDADAAAELVECGPGVNSGSS